MTEKTKQPRLGTDPLAWIGEVMTGKSKPGKHSKSLKSKDRPSIERGLAPGWTRATLIVRKKHLDKLRALVYWTPGATIKGLVDNALGDYLKGKRTKAVPKTRGQEEKK